MLTADQRETLNRKLRAFRSTLDDAESLDDVCNAMSLLADSIELVAEAQGTTAAIDDAFASLRQRAQRGL